MSGRGGILAAIVELRARLLLRRLRGTGGTVELVARAVTYLLAVPVAIAFAALAGAASYRAVRSGGSLYVDTAVAGLFFGVWQAWTAVSLSLQDREALDLRRFLVYPVPTGRIWGYGLVAAVAGDPFALFWSILLAGAFCGAALARPGAWLLVLALAMALFIAATVLLVALLEELVARVVRRRAVRVVAIAAAYVALGGVAFSAASGARSFFELLRAVGKVRWLAFPPALAAEAAKDLYRGDVAGALPWLAALAPLALLTAWAAHRLALAAARSGGEGNAAAAGSARGGWPLDALPGRVGPLLEKDAKVLLRHPLAAVLSLVVPGFAALVSWRAVPHLPPEAGDVVRALPLFGFAFYGHVVTQVFWLNSFGWDRAGARAAFLAPVRGADVLVAKNAAVLGLSAVLFLGSLATSVAFAGAPPGWAIAGAIALHLGVAPWMFAAGNAVSVLSPRAMRPGLQRGSALPAASTLAGVAIVTGAGGLFALPVPFALWLDAPLVLVGGWIALGLAGVLVYRAALGPVERLLERRREALLAAVVGDE